MFLFLFLFLFACSAGSSPEPAAPQPLARLVEVEWSSSAFAGDVTGSAQEVVVESTEEARAEGVQVSVDQGPGLLVEAPHSRFSLETKLAVFEGGVSAERGLLRLRCDKLEVRYDDLSQVTTATATGAVTLHQGTWTAHADIAALDLITETVSLSGNATVSDGKNRLGGERIRMDLAGEELECDDCRVVMQEPEE